MFFYKYTQLFETTKKIKKRGKCIRTDSIGGYNSFENECKSDTPVLEFTPFRQPRIVPIYFHFSIELGKGRLIEC